MFWNGRWEERKDDNFNVEWLKTLKDNDKYWYQEGLVVSEESVLRQSRKVSNWNTPGRDVVQGF